MRVWQAYSASEVILFIWKDSLAEVLDWFSDPIVI